MFAAVSSSASVTSCPLLQVIKIGPCHRVDGNLNLSRARETWEGVCLRWMSFCIFIIMIITIIFAIVIFKCFFFGLLDLKVDDLSMRKDASVHYFSLSDANWWWFIRSFPVRLQKGLGFLLILLRSV